MALMAVLAALMVVATVALDTLKIVTDQVSAGLSHGLATDLKIVQIRHMVLTFAVTMVMVATAQNLHAQTVRMKV